jgi:hypothetical protein
MFGLTKASRERRAAQHAAHAAQEAKRAERFAREQHLFAEIADAIELGTLNLVTAFQPWRNGAMVSVSLEWGGRLYLHGANGSFSDFPLTGEQGQRLQRLVRTARAAAERETTAALGL